MFFPRVFVSLSLLISLLTAASVEELAGQLSKDAYLAPVAITAKYAGRFKTRSFETHGVQFFKLSGKEGEFVVFRGTDNTANWLTNLTVSAVDFDGVAGAKVHSGFYEVARTAVEKLALKKDANVLVCGHSLGGAVALLTGAILHEEGYDVEVVTFGAPPVGNEAFVEAFDSLPHARFEHILDLVPKADKKSIAALQSLLKEVNTDTMGYGSLRTAVAYLKSMPYEFVQHGEGRVLTHVLEIENPFSSELLEQPLRYHGMESYLMAFEGGAEEEEL